MGDVSSVGGNNEAEAGQGYSGGSVELVNSTLTSITTTGGLGTYYGGAGGAVTLTNSNITSITTIGGGDYGGGQGYTGGSITLTNSNASTINAGGGSGGSDGGQGGNVVLVNSIVTDISSTAGGGGLGGGIDAGGGGSVTLTNSTVTTISTIGAVAGSGGVGTFGGPVIVTNSNVTTITTSGGASRGGYGGESQIGAGTVTITNSNVAGAITAIGYDESTSSVGGAGGVVNITNSNITNLTTTGGTAASGTGGAGGAVTITNSTATGISTAGAAALGFLGAAGGAGGAVTITNSTTTTITTTGGTGDSNAGAGGTGGAVIITNSNATTIDTTGGTGGGAADAGGTGGAVTITDSSTVTTITSIGGGDGGDGGAVTVTNSNTTTIAATGTLGTSNGGTGGTVEIINSTTGGISTDGGSIMSGTSGGAGGAITATNSIIPSITSTGGTPGASGAGGSGGGVTIQTNSNIGTITTSGGVGAGGPYNGGAAGGLTLINSNMGTITAIGGSTSSGMPDAIVGGAGGTVSITNSTITSIDISGGGATSGGGTATGGVAGTVTAINSLIYLNGSITFTGGAGDPVGTNGTLILNQTSLSNTNGSIKFSYVSTNQTSFNLILSLENNSAYVNSTNYVDYNVTANVTLNNIGERELDNPTILKDGAECTDCYNFTALNADTVIFNVTSWSNYSVGETSGMDFNVSLEVQNQTTVYQGDIVPYLVNITNTGETEITNISIKDIYDVDFNYSSASVAPNSIDYDNRIVYWNNITVNLIAGDSYLFYINLSAIMTANSAGNTVNTTIYNNHGISPENTNSVEIAILERPDTAYPIFSGYWDDNGTLTSSGTAHFNVTVENTNGTVIFLIGGNSYAATNISNFYSTSMVLTNGTYQYNWTSYGNGTNHLENYSTNFYYTVNNCIANITNTTKSDWANLTCVGSQMNQTRNWTQYDSSDCGYVGEVSYNEYQLVGPTFANDTFSAWTNISCLLGDNMNQTRNATQYDIYSCGANSTVIEYRASEYCAFDTIYPTINFTTQTETSGTTLITRSNILINVTANDTNLKNITIKLYNSTRALVNSTNTTMSSLFANFTGLSYDTYYFNATACDTSGNCNNTETRNVTIEASVVEISLPTNSTNIGNLVRGQQSINLAGLVISNDGNTYVNIEMNATDMWAGTHSWPGNNYLYRVGNAGEGNETNGTYSRDSMLNWTQISSVKQTAIYSLNWSSDRNTAALDFNITVPSDESAGDKVSTIYITVVEA